MFSRRKTKFNLRFMRSDIQRQEEKWMYIQNATKHEKNARLCGSDAGDESLEELLVFANGFVKCGSDLKIRHLGGGVRKMRQVR